MASVQWDHRARLQNHSNLASDVDPRGGRNTDDEVPDPYPNQGGLTAEHRFDHGAHRASVVPRRADNHPIAVYQDRSCALSQTTQRTPATGVQLNQVYVTQAPCYVHGPRFGPHFSGGADALDSALAQHRDPVGYRECFVPVVGHVQRSLAERAQ